MIYLLSRTMFFMCGFHWITIRGRRAPSSEAPLLVVAPHSTFFDPIVTVVCDLPSVVSRIENLNIPVIGALLRFNQSIMVSRHDRASRKKVVEEVKRRATSQGEWPQLLFFPEGTNGNGKVLLKFKPGAFVAGVPVQPVLMRYPNRLVSPGVRDQGRAVCVFSSCVCCLPLSFASSFLNYLLFLPFAPSKALIQHAMKRLPHAGEDFSPTPLNDILSIHLSQLKTYNIIIFIIVPTGELLGK
ncbi:hypothetical protein FKM82_025168 [Ascaphus truei]